MAGIFDGLIAQATSSGGSAPASWDPWSKAPRTLDPAVLQWLRANPQGGIGPDGFFYAGQAAGDFTNESGTVTSPSPVPGVDGPIYRTKPGPDGNIGKRNDFEVYDPSGQYQSSYIGGAKSWLDKNGWVLPAAVIGGAYLMQPGVLGGAGTAGTTAADVATKSLGQLAPLTPGQAAAIAPQTSLAWGSTAPMAMADLGIAAIPSVGAGLGGGSGGGFLNGLKEVGGAIKEGIGAIPGLGNALATGAALGLAKDIKPAAPDSALTSSINSLTGSANKANAAADADEQYFRDVFGPRYLAAMDDQIRMGRELSDFNMGLARKYDQRYWDTTARFEDQFYRDVDNYNDEDQRRLRRNQAGATVEQETSAGLNQLVRNLDRRGLNPNSGVVLSQMRQGAQQGTLNKALAMNLAEEAARMEGLNLKATAAGMGRGLPGTSAGFAGQAASAAGLGMSGIAGAQQGYNANRSTWNSTLGRGDNAIGQVGQWGASLTGMANTAKSNNAQGWNQIIGTGLGMFGPKVWGN